MCSLIMLADMACWRLLSLCGWLWACQVQRHFT